jgi:chromosome segregation ATPase
MLVDAEAAGMHADCPSCGCHLSIPKMRGINDRDMVQSKPASRKREGARAGAAVVGKGSARRTATDSETNQFSDPELSDLRQELLDASVQTSELERELVDARTRAESFSISHRKLQDELKRLSDEHQALCNKYTFAAGDRDTAVACTQRMADEIEQLRSRAEAAEALMEEAHQQLEALRAERIELTQAVATAQEEVAAYGRQVQEQEYDLIAERAQHVETQSERTAATRKIEAQEQHLAALQTEIASARAALVLAEENALALEVTEQKLADTTERLKSSEGRVSQMEKELLDSSAECQSLRRSLSESTTGRDLMIARDQFAEVSKQRERLAGEVRQLSDDLQTLTAAKVNRDEQFKTLSRELEEARRRAEAASEARLRQDNEVLRGIIARQNTELEQKHAQLVRLKRARLGVRLAYASFALGLVLVAAWAIKTVPGLQLSSFLKF